MKVKFNALAYNAHLHRNEIQAAIDNVIKSGSFILAKEVKRFENNFASYIGTKHCVGVANGLEAIQIALMALGVKKGDEVITTPLSAVATTLAIIAVGAEPVFVETDEIGLIDPQKVEKSINKKTMAILPVHLYGQNAHIQKLKKICQKQKIFLVEDAAQAHGSAYRGQKLGTFGQIGCFSFYPTKNLGAFGDAGAIVTNNHKVAQMCKKIRNYGQSSKYLHQSIGLNSRLDEIQAAILNVKLKYLERENSKRRKIAQRYIKNLSKLPINIVTDDLPNSNFHLFVIRTKKRDKLQQFLAKNGIETLIHYPTIIPNQPIFANLYKKQNFINAKNLSSEVLSLPCHPNLTLNEVDTVCEKISQFFHLAKI